MTTKIVDEKREVHMRFSSDELPALYTSKGERDLQTESREITAEIIPGEILGTWENEGGSLVMCDSGK